MAAPKVFTPEEARAVLRIGRSRMYELLRSGQIKSVRNGRRFLIPEECLLQYIREQTAVNTKGRDPDA